MKIRNLKINRHRRMFEVETYGGRTYRFPFARAEPAPTRQDPVVEAYADPELGREALTYVLASGAEGSVHLDHVLEYNQDPTYLRDLLVYKLSLEAKKRMAESSLSVREITRRLGTSAAQLYRLVDPANSRKSMDKLIQLLAVLDCDVEIVVKPKAA